MDNNIEMEIPIERASNMELVLMPQEYLSPLEAMLTIYTPILESLASNLPTPSKLALSHTSRHLRNLLYSYPLFFAHLDFRLPVFESTSFDSYRLGTVYNLDRLLSTFPLENRLVSLTLDWTAVTGYLLFDKIMNRCQGTLEHLSVRGCRKVSIKHHIVPYLVYQDSIEPLSVSTTSPPKRVLKSLYVYKARGVRRKPFLVDRKPADGDEPSRYLTILAKKLGIYVDLGFCPTPKLMCPSRREILRQRKEKFCVPFDKRWRVQESSSNSEPPGPLSLLEDKQRRAFEEAQGTNISCDQCDVRIPDRCEACVHQMTCTNCNKALCYNCAYRPPSVPSSESGDENTVQPQQNLPPQFVGLPIFPTTAAFLTGAATPPDLEANLSVHALRPCCNTIPPSAADNLCAACHLSAAWAYCDGCSKKICMKHELDRCRRCSGGCNKLFCVAIQTTGCGELQGGKAKMKECLGCGNTVCFSCRNRAMSSSPTPTAVTSDDDDDDDENEDTTISTEIYSRYSGCNCSVCEEYYYCPTCWPTKTTDCELRPKEILDRKDMEDGTTLYQISFWGGVQRQRWITAGSIMAQYADNGGPELIATFEASHAASQAMNLLDLSEEPLTSHPMTAPSTSKNEDEDVEETLIVKRIIAKRSYEMAELYLVEWRGRENENGQWINRDRFHNDEEMALLEDFERNVTWHAADEAEGSGPALSALMGPAGPTEPLEESQVGPEEGSSI
ncbi:hypothetical protein RUND412_003417 [Rhizina undulata]